MHCSNCNKTIPDGSTHCPYCYSIQDTTKAHKSYQQSASFPSQKSYTSFITVPAFLVTVVEIILLVWWNNCKELYEVNFILEAIVSWNTLSVILIILTGVNLVFWLIMRCFSKLLYVEPVHPALYVISIVLAVCSSFLPNLINIVVLPAWMIIITSYTMVQLRAITKNADESSISAILPIFGVWGMAVILIVSWFSTDASGFAAWSWIIVIDMVVHILSFCILGLSWGKTKQFAQKNGIKDVSKTSTQNQTTPTLKNYCGKCGRSIPENSEFCPKCGAEVIRLDKPKSPSCTKCGITVPDDSDFCLKCGTKIIKPAPIKSVICPNCKNEIPNSSEFCTKCGLNLDELFAKEEIKSQTDEAEEDLAKELRKNEILKRQDFYDDYRKTRRLIILPPILLVGIAALIRIIQFNTPA